MKMDMYSFICLFLLVLETNKKRPSVLFSHFSPVVWLTTVHRFRSRCVYLSIYLPDVLHKR